jgi:hypothetical protein
MDADEVDMRAVLDRAVGENLDRLISLDMRGDQLIPAINQAARDRQGGPLTLAAAIAILGRVRAGARGVVILTGFRIPPSGVPETDGIIGSAVVAYSLVRALGGIPIFVCEPEVHDALDAALRAVGLQTSVRATEEDLAEPVLDGCALIAPFGLDADAEGCIETLERLAEIGACLAIERPGRNAQGYYHFAGGMRVEGFIAPVDDIFIALGGRGVPTIAIGDMGNELGMGVVSDALRSGVPSGADCGCGCGGGVACPIAASATIACTVSDWGAYALAAMICHLTDRPDGMVTRDVYERTVHASNFAGAIDGTSRLAIPHIDGIAFDFHKNFFDLIQGVVGYPNRPTMNNANRQFAARRAANAVAAGTEHS